MYSYIPGSGPGVFLGRYNEDRAKGIIFSGGRCIPVPCQRCNGCRLDYSKRWADRMLLEFRTDYSKVDFSQASARMKSYRDYDSSRAIFLTLTYDDDHLHYVKAKSDGSPLSTLCQRDIQLFFKLLRRRLGDHRIRYYYAGEYGEKSTCRPHYHAIIFGLSVSDFSDSFLYDVNKDRGTVLYESPFLDSLWTHGVTVFADANYHTFCYVARYVVKKQFGIDKLNWDGRAPPHNASSKGLGAYYFDSRNLDVDRVTLNDGLDSHQVSVPRVVLDKIKSADPDTYDLIMEQRRQINQGKSDLIMSLTDKSYLTYLHDCEVNFNLRHGLLYKRSGGNLTKVIKVDTD